jgi:hypothetical protein
MAEALILEFDGIGQAEYELVNKELGIDTATREGDWPGGLLMHAAGLAESGALVVTEVWSSRQEQATFMESRLGAALGAGGVTAPPKVTWVSLLTYTPLGD